MTVRHHIEYQSTDNRFREVHSTADYEDFVSHGDEENQDINLEQWMDGVISYIKDTNSGRVRIWKVTREEIELT